MALTKATLIDLNSNELILDLDADTSITADTDDTIHFKIAGSDEITMTATAIAPSTSDGQALGTSSLMFSDLFVASGSVINFNNGDVTLTHSSNLLTLDGGSLDLDGEALILDADGDTKLVESSDDVIHMQFAGSTNTPTEFGAGYINLKNQGTKSYMRFYCESSNAHYTQLEAAAHSAYSGNATVTLPTATSTLATLALSETLTNKTLTSPDINTSIELLARAEARFQDASGGQFVGLEAPATVSSSFVLTLPAADGSSGQFLKTDGSGALSFDTVSSAADDLTIGDAAVTLSTSSGNITIDATANDSDIIFKGTDNTADITMLTLDGSDAGTAIFNHDIKIADDGQIGSASAADAMIISSGGIVTFKDDILIKDGGTIGSASDADAIAIASDGQLTLTQQLNGTAIDMSGDITGSTLNADGDTAAGDNAAIGYTAAEGLILTGQGSTDDITVKNDADTTVLNVATGATDVEVSAGNLLFGTADKGVYLGVTSATAANLLADYEEGSWTPTVTTGGANPDFSSGTQRGRYVKVGKLVMVHCEMKYTSSSSNIGQWGGLPFSTSNEESGNLSQTGLITHDRNTTTYHNVYIANDTKWYIRAMGTMSGGLQTPSDFSGQIMAFNHTYIST